MVSTVMSVEKVKIPEGYKQTEVGVIPEDWSISTVNNVSLVPMQNGLFYEPQRKGKGVPLINVGDMYASAPIDVSSLDLFDATHSEMKVFKVQKGDLFFTRSSIVPSGIAYCNTFKEENTVAVFDSHLIRVRPDQKVMDADFLYLNCIASRARKFLISSAKTATMTTIDQGAIKKCPVLVPPIKEQTAIANALSDVDNLIAALETLIAKKSAIKTAAMQQLLTGKKRLPAFEKKGAKQSRAFDHSSDTAQATQTQHAPTLDNKLDQKSDAANPNTNQTAPRPGYKQSELGEVPEDWEVVELGQVVSEFRNGYSFSALGYRSSGIPIITMSQIGLSGRFKFDLNKIKFWDIKQADRLKDFWVKSGDLLIAMTDVTPEKNLIGQMAIAKLTGVALLNQRVGLLRLNAEKASAEFLNYLSCLPIFRSYCKGVASLGVQANIGTTDIKKALIPLPEVEEQTAIANVLSDMDTELDALQQRLSKTQKIKQGMMQELLTGKTRLVC